MAQCPTRLQRSTRQSAAGSCAATALLELCILAPAHPPERECCMSRGCRQRARGGMEGRVDVARVEGDCKAVREPARSAPPCERALYCTPACERPCVSRDRHAPELCRLSAEVVSVRVSGRRRGSPPPCPPWVRDYYTTIPIGYNFTTCTATRRAPFPYKLTRPCQLVRVTQRRLSQLAPRHLPLSPPPVG